MKTVLRNPFAFTIAFLFLLQLPVYISGNAASSSRKTSHSDIINLSAVPVKDINTVILQQADSIYDAIHLDDAGVDSTAFQLAYKGYHKLLQEGFINNEGILTIADFSKSSSEKRLYVIDMINEKLLFNTLVAHGRNSGLRYASSFSNKPESNKSSLGFYLTLDTYYGGNGYSLKLRGLEKGINDKAYDRAIVLHGSDYVNNAFANSNGFLGRSFGCPAVPRKLAAGIINTIKNGSVLFIYHPAKNYIDKSTILNS